MSNNHDYKALSPQEERPSTLPGGWQAVPAQLVLAGLVASMLAPSSSLLAPPSSKT